MKISTAVLLLSLPVMAVARDYQGMSERDMQNMMQQMQGMQTCMQGIDQDRVKAFEQRANRVEAEVNSLCASGKRDDAQQLASDFGLEMASNPDIQNMLKCGEMMRGMMPKMPFTDPSGGPDTAERHVCDG